MKRDSTASCYIFSPDERKTLLIHHKKLKTWLPPGGHVEENELPHEAALREAYEETGYRVEIIDTSPLIIEEWNARSIPSPFLVLLENIPAWKDVPAHQHIDYVYLSYAIQSDTHMLDSQKVEEECRWFFLQDIENLTEDTEIFSETKQVLKYLFTKNNLIWSD